MNKTFSTKMLQFFIRIIDTKLFVFVCIEAFLRKKLKPIKPILVY